MPGLGPVLLQIELLAGALCFVIVGIWIIFILIAIWVYRDAESRGMSGVLWLIVVILLGIIGLIIYLVVRSDHPVGGRPGYPTYPPAYPPQYPPQQPPSPPQAQGVGPVAGATCRSCGAPLSPGVGFCPRCGAKT